MGKEAHIEYFLSELSGNTPGFIQAAFIDGATGQMVVVPVTPGYFIDPDFPLAVIKLCNTGQTVLRAAYTQSAAAFSKDKQESNWQYDCIQLRQGKNLLLILPDTASGLIIAALLEPHARVGVILPEMAQTLVQIQKIWKS